MSCLHNYIINDTPAFLSQPDRVETVFEMSKHVIVNDLGEDTEAHAAKLLEVVILQCQDHMTIVSVDILPRRLDRRLSSGAPGDRSTHRSTLSTRYQHDRTASDAVASVHRHSLVESRSILPNALDRGDERPDDANVHRQFLSSVDERLSKFRRSTRSTRLRPRPLYIVAHRLEILLDHFQHRAGNSAELHSDLSRSDQNVRTRQ